MRILKYFKRPNVIFRKDKWKYDLCEIIKSMFYACLIIALSAVAVTVFMYALLTPDY